MGISIANGAGSKDFGENFAPKDHLSTLVILFEPKQMRRGVKTTFGEKDFLDMDYTVFGTHEQLDSGKPEKIVKNGSCGGNLANNLSEYVGRMTAGSIGQAPTNKGNPAWIVEQVDNSIIEKVVAYVEAREAEVEKAKEDLPDFLKG